MIRIVGTALILLALPPTVGALDEDKSKAKTPGEQVKALEREFTEAQASFMKEYQAAKTQEAKQKLFQEKYPNPAKYSARFMKLAEDNPKDPAAVDALVWVVSRNPYVFAKDGVRNKALDIILRDHVKSDKLGPVCSALSRSFDTPCETFLNTVLEKNPHSSVKGAACLALAQSIESRISIHDNLKNTPQMVTMYERNLGKEDTERLQKLEPEKTRKQAIEYLERVVKDYADAKDAKGQAIGPAAQSKLDGLRHPIEVGKEVPVVMGEDIDGKKFKLGDYRGKVVLLDFWGHW